MRLFLRVGKNAALQHFFGVNRRIADDNPQVQVCRQITFLQHRAPDEANRLPGANRIARANRVEHRQVRIAHDDAAVVDFRVRADTSFSCEEAADLLLRAFPGCGVTADTLPSAIRLQSTTASGRVATLLVGSQTVRGADFRKALSLRSTYFTWEADGDRIVFHTVGYGHGVGLSQAGAQAMAADGADFAEILAHYYPGTQLTRMDKTGFSGS